jgi:translocation and assembly module TamB
MLGGAALTVGQYLSPRVYLSYGVGLFEPGEVITLRYKLSRDLSVQAQRGPEDTRAGIEFRTQR